MSYTINKLSAIKVRSVSRPGMYGDGAGLWLQVSAHPIGRRNTFMKLLRRPIECAVESWQSPDRCGVT
jgi:hypothetical protein